MLISIASGAVECCADSGDLGLLCLGFGHAAAGTILIGGAFATTWDYEAKQVWAAAKDHVWVHCPTTAEVSVDSHVPGSHERPHEACGLDHNL